MPVAQQLLEILRCPESQGELIYFDGSNSEEEFLFCPQSRLRFRVSEGIPVMLVEDAERLDVEASTALEATAKSLGLVTS